MLCEGRPRDASGAPAKKDDLLQSFWQFVTDLGDSAVTLPLAAFTLLYLSLSHWQRAAAALAVSLAAGGSAIALLKLALQSCGYHLLQTTLINPSGHVAMSAMIYGALAIILGGGLSGWWRWAVHGVFILLIAAIALSRLMLHAHNQAEVLAGLLVGLGALVIFHRLQGPALPGGLRVEPAGARRPAAGRRDAWHALAHRGADPQYGGADPGRRPAMRLTGRDH